MKANVCDSNHLDENVLPPPRKRLLAGFKKQNESSSDSSPVSISASLLTTLEVMCAKNLLCYHSSGGSSSSSLEDIVESSNKAAVVAAKAAEAARAAAGEKATVAARAIAAAKSALELMEMFSVRSSDKDRHTKKNKSKKQITVHSLYKKHDEVENGKTDGTEGNSHHVMYKPPAFYVRSSTSAESLSHKHKKPNVSPYVGKPKFPNEGSPKSDSHAMCNGKATLDTEGSIHEEADPLDTEKRSQCLTTLISSNRRVEKDIVSHRRKARKQLIRMVE